MIYLDNAATTQVDPEVLEAMMPYLKEEFGNPGSLHTLGRNAANAVGEARKKVAEYFGAKPNQIVFTSGGSEGNNMVFRAFCERLSAPDKVHILVSGTEHESVLRAVEGLTKGRFDIQFLPVNEQGIVPFEVVKSNIKWNTGLVSVMYVNNEVGSVNPIEEIGTLCNLNGTYFHVDCVQATGMTIDVDKMGCDFATISGHKLHAPKGVGAIYARNPELLNPLIYGGEHQEFGLRGGTENVPGIVALGKACELDRKVSYRTEFYKLLMSHLEKSNLSHIVHINGADPNVDGKILNLRFDGINGESLLLLLNSFNVCVSAGSACCSKNIEPSHVLTAMGLSAKQANESIRISFSRLNTYNDIKLGAEILARCVSILAGGMNE